MGSGSLEVPEDNGVTSDWKWPYPDSWYFPGAKVAVFAAWAVGFSVLQAGSDTRYVVDWQRLFMKAWPDMPTTPIPIESVAFANEVVGAVHLHTAVSDVRQMSASPGTPTVSLAINGSARAEVEPGEQLHYVLEDRECSLGPLHVEHPGPPLRSWSDFGNVGGEQPVGLLCPTAPCRPTRMQLRHRRHRPFIQRRHEGRRYPHRAVIRH